MNFLEAMCAVDEGHQVRRRAWLREEHDPGRVIVPPERINEAVGMLETSLSTSQRPLTLRLADIFGEDWEVTV